MKNNIETKVNDILNSAEDKVDLKTLAQVELMGFLSSMIHKAKEEDEILSEANKQLMERLRKSEDEPLSLSALLRIIELKEKHKTEISNPIMKILESAVKPQPKEVDSPLTPSSNSNKGSNINQEDYTKAKEAYKKLDVLQSMLDKIRETEFNENEEIKND